MRTKQEIRLCWILYAMRQRCLNKNNKWYPCYGGRGITICEEWKNGTGNFLKWCIASGYKEGLSIDRINNDGNYEPKNCRWANVFVQQHNKRPDQKSLRQDTLKAIAKKNGVKYDSFKYRVKKMGLTIEQALTMPKYYKGYSNEPKK